MSLEEHIQQKRILIRKYPSAEVLAQAEKGNKFIVVQDDFDPNYTPQGYTLIDMKHRGNSFKILVPQALLFYVANPGEGDSENALDEIADFYDETEDFEDEMIEEGKTNVQEANWVNLARNSYETYLINKLVKHKKWKTDKDGEPIPEFNSDILKKLDLDSDYVTQRMKAIAALALGKTINQIKEHEIKDVLKHITVSYQKEEIKRELREVKCWAGSHYEVRHEYKTSKELVEKQESHTVLDSKIKGLESEIEEYRKLHSNIGRHDKDLIREYINLAYIAKENPKAQLDITPPEKEKK